MVRIHSFSRLVMHHNEPPQRMSLFELSQWRVSWHNYCMRLCIIYHQPYSTSHPITDATFMHEDMKHYYAPNRQPSKKIFAYIFHDFYDYITFLHTKLIIILLMKHYWKSWKYLLLLFSSFKFDFRVLLEAVSDNRSHLAFSNLEEI